MSIGLYIHIPFCIRKCNYCDFVSAPPNGQEQVEHYLLALEKELEIYSQLLALPGIQYPVDTIYIGGGTPTILTAEQLVRVLKKCRGLFAWQENADVTIEANPGTVDLRKLQLLKKAGVNRISFGIQSFDHALLKAMGRIHTAETARESIAMARQAGFVNLSTDLIFGLPGQTLAQWEATLDQALKLEVQHLSLYGLKIEEGTPWGKLEEKDLLLLPEEEAVLKMRDLADSKLSAKGYLHYEISNYALPGFEARHNIRYWKNQEYIGVGLGASSKAFKRRFINVADLHGYIDLLEAGQLPIAEEELLTIKQSMGETVFLGLRLLRGLDCGVFYKRFGIELEAQYKAELGQLLKLGLVEMRNGYLCLTPKGLPIANSVFAYFV